VYVRNGVRVKGGPSCARGCTFRRNYLLDSAKNVKVEHLEAGCQRSKEEMIFAE
jgi:hypothetical protein